jgi:hypothetical protein
MYFRYQLTGSRAAACSLACTLAFTACVSQRHGAPEVDEFEEGRLEALLAANKVDADCDLFMQFDAGSAPNLVQPSLALWQQQFDLNDGRGAPTHIAADNHGSVYVAGQQGGNGEQRHDVFVAKYDTDGAQIWLRELPGDRVEKVAALAVDAENAYVMVRSASDEDHPRVGTEHLLVKLDRAGTRQWSHSYGALSWQWDELHGIAVDSAGSIYVTGSRMVGEMMDELTDSDLLVAKHDSAGNLIAQRTLGTTSHAEIGKAVAIDAAGFVEVTGSMYAREPGAQNAGSVRYRFDADLDDDGVLVNNAESPARIPHLSQGGTTFKISVLAAAETSQREYSTRLEVHAQDAGSCVAAEPSDILLQRFAAHGAESVFVWSTLNAIAPSYPTRPLLEERFLLEFDGEARQRSVLRLHVPRATIATVTPSGEVYAAGEAEPGAAHGRLFIARHAARAVR